VLTYNRPAAALTGLGLAVDTAIRKVADEVGEPFISLFEPAEIERLLREQGFDDVIHFGPDEAIQTYFAGRTDVVFAGAQRLVIATVAPSRGKPPG
jgi:hypothetical protein